MPKATPEPGKTIGQWMVYASWILLLALLTALFNRYLEKQYNPNTQVQTVSTSDGTDEVSLTRNRYGHYLASGLINGRPATFLLDTGATNISIPGALARPLRLERGAPHSVMTANGKITVYSTRLDSVAIGPIEIRGLLGAINPHQSGEEILLGMNFLKHLEIIQQGDRLVLRMPVSGM